MRQKTIFNWSGGKDSALALYHLQHDDRFEITGLLTSISTAFDRVSMHGVRRELLMKQAASIGLPVQELKLPESLSMSEYDDRMKACLEEVKSRGVEFSAFGDIFLEDLKAYREEKLAEVSLTGLFPIWKKNTNDLLEEFLDLGFQTVLVCIKSDKLDESFVGRVIDRDFVKDLPSDVDPCGENGEFHTFVFDGPIFKEPIKYQLGETVYREYKAPDDCDDSCMKSDCVTKMAGYYFKDLLPVKLGHNFKMVKEFEFSIRPLPDDLDESIWKKINSKTKPVGALGALEEMAFKISRIQHTLAPKLNSPVIALFAGDHGIAKSGMVNPYPQEVTSQMVLNFLEGGAAINVFARQVGIEVKVIDSGVNCDFSKQENLIDAKMGKGTNDYRHQKAMDIETAEEAISIGGKIVSEFAQRGTNIVGFGEMGIGNTSSAALIMSALCGIPVSKCVGKGTGADGDFLKQKTETLKEVSRFHGLSSDDSPTKILAAYGGFEIAQMVGGILSAASNKMIILVDGFISSAAFLLASKINPLVSQYAIFTHLSEEQGHRRLLHYLDASPLLNIGMRLGEGTGCAAAYPLLKMSVAFMNEMASFETASVSKKTVE